MSSRARIHPAVQLVSDGRAGMIRALTFDYWDTLYDGGRTPERVALRRTAVGALLGAYGRALPEEQLRALYEESRPEQVSAEAEAVDNALLLLPPAMFPGAWQLLRDMSRRYMLGIISDTGFAS